jgi:hypothetical protein
MRMLKTQLLASTGEAREPSPPTLGPRSGRRDPGLPTRAKGPKLGNWAKKRN